MNTLTEAFRYLLDLLALGIDYDPAYEHAVRLFELTQRQSTILRLMYLAKH